MPDTTGPNYTAVLKKPYWGPPANPNAMNALQQPMVQANVDLIRAEHINSLRLIIDLIYDHSHSYTDSIGSC